MFLGVLNEEKKEACAKKRSSKNSRGAVNLRFAPGVRHPSYATANESP